MDKMKIRAALLDLDGTLVTEDILDVVCDVAGKRAESEELNRSFLNGLRVGLDILVERVNLLQGVSIRSIEERLQEEPYLREGASELIEYLKQNGIVTAIQSCNIMPVLQYYQRVLGIDYVLGTKPIVEGGVIQGLSRTDLPERDFKLGMCGAWLNEHGTSPQEAIAFGDSKGDRKVFELVGASIAVNPSSGIERYATATIYDDLKRAIPIIEGMRD